MEGRPLDLLPRTGPGGGWREVYELLGETSALPPETLARRDLFWTAVIFYRERRYVDALERFFQAHAGNNGENIEDGPLEFYLRRIEGVLGQHRPALGTPEGNGANEPAGETLTPS